jgi:hypothetical protein
MSDPLSIILHSISQYPATATIIAAFITAIGTWLARPKRLKESAPQAATHVETVRRTETLRTTVTTTRTVEEQRTTVGKR